VLKQKQTLLKIHPEQHTDTHTYFQYGGDSDDSRVGYYLSMPEWVAMGCPEEIVVSSNIDTTIMSEGLTDQGVWGGEDEDLNHRMVEWDIDNNCPMAETIRLEKEEARG